MMDNNLKYRLIVMDCNMPRLDGYAATEQIRSIYKEARDQ